MPTDETSQVRIEREGAYAHVFLNRPAKHNAFDWGMFEGLLAAANELADDRGVRGVFVRGEGPSFSSGLDIPSFGKTPVRALQVFFQPGSRVANIAQEVCLRWRKIGAPVFAVVHGNCFGAGLQLALGADFRFVHPDAKLSIMEAKWGLVPDMGGSVLLRELVGIDVAKMLTMTARVIDADAALRFGLATVVDADPLAAARVLADEIATRSPDAVAAAKSLFQETWTAAESDALSIERRLQARMFASANRRIAVKQLSSKADRPATWGPRRFRP